MATGLPALSTFLGLSSNFLDGPASSHSRINTLLFNIASEMVPINITSFALGIPSILGGTPVNFPPLVGGTAGNNNAPPRGTRLSSLLNQPASGPTDLKVQIP